MSENGHNGASAVPQTVEGHAVTIHAEDEGQAILMMDRYDLEQALAELKGEVIEQFVYLVPGKNYTNKAGRKVVVPEKRQLSYAGIKEAARLYKNVAFGANAAPLADGRWMITSWAHNIADNVRVEYPYPYPAFDPADDRQSIEFRATVSKAMRNALAAVLPIAYLTTMIQKWDARHDGRVQQRSPTTAAAPTPAPRRAPLAHEQPDDPALCKHFASEVQALCPQLGWTAPKTLRDWATLADALGLEAITERGQLTSGRLRAMRDALGHKILAATEAQIAAEAQSEASGARRQASGDAEPDGAEPDGELPPFYDHDAGLAGSPQPVAHAQAGEEALTPGA
jgi:hypothetical protein